MGIIADRTKASLGPIFVLAALVGLPFAGIFWMTFTRPILNPPHALVYAYVTYFLLMAIYTVNNVPYCALNGVMTATSMSVSASPPTASWL